MDRQPVVTLARPRYRSHLITPPLGLGYLSSYLMSRGCETRIIDGLNRNLTAQQIAGQCRGSLLVGVSVMTAYLPEAAELVSCLKKEGHQVAIGGPHASALPEEALEMTGADFAVAGEGEETLHDLVRALSRGLSPDTVPGVAVRRKGPLFQERAFIPNLDDLPFPDWKAMDPRTYRKAPHGGLIRAFPVAPVISSRGCPFRCSFCASPSLWKRTFRIRSPENVAEEIEYLVRDFKVREIHFEDDNLTLKRDHAEGICRAILKRGLRVHWAAPNGVRIDTLDEDLLRLMKKSGCYFLAFGIESGSQAVLDLNRKKQDLADVERVVRLAHSLGLLTQGFFIFGLPGETPETVEQTLAFARKIPLDRAQFLLLDLLPGSDLYDELKDTRPACRDYRSYQEAAWAPEGLTREFLNRVPGRAFRRFFLRPRPLLSLLKYARISQLPYIVRRIGDFRVFSPGRAG